MAAKKTAGQKKPKRQALRNKGSGVDMGENMKTGVTYISSWGTIDASEIDSSTILKYRNNVYAKGVARRQKFLIFTDRPTVTVYDQNGDAVDELKDRIMSMADRAGLFDLLQVLYDEMFWYGAGFVNPVWTKDGSEWVLKELNHLPSDSFTSAPSTVTTVYSNVLQGVTLEDNEIAYYQLQDLNSMVPVRLSGNVLMIKDPTESGLTGSPMVLPLIAILKMMDFAWDAQMMRINRVGAPFIFVEVTNGSDDDIAYAQKLLKNWGRKTQYVLRDNMKVVTLDIKESDSAPQTINILNQLLIEFFSPASSLTKEGSLIGGSDWGASELLKSYIGGIHRMIETFANDMFQPYLDANLYVGHTVEWKMPAMSIDRSEIALKQAQVGYDTRSLTVNERRKRLEADELDEVGLAALEEEYKNIPVSGSGNPGAPTPLGVVPPVMSMDNSPDPVGKKVEVSLEDQIKELYDKLAEKVIAALDHEESA